MALALALIVLSNYFFGTGENLIAAFLPELADSRAMGRVSGWGWAFGYLGGLVALGICLFYLMSSGQADEPGGAGDDADHRRVLRRGGRAHVRVPAGARRCRRRPSPTRGSA